MTTLIETEPLLSAFRKFAAIYKKPPQGDEFVELFVDSLDPADYRFYLIAALRRTVPGLNYETNQARVKSVEKQKAEITKTGAKYSGKVASISSWWQDILDKTMPSDHGTIRLGDATKADLLWQAEELMKHATATAVTASAYEKQAALLEKYKVTYVRDLPPAAQAEFPNV